LSILVTRGLFINIVMCLDQIKRSSICLG